MVKEMVLDAIIEEQKTILNDIRQTIAVYETTVEVNTDALDSEDYSHKAEAKEMQLRFEEKLKEEEAIFHFLLKNKDKETSSVEKGALIETDSHYIFIGTSVRPITINDKVALSVSKKAPIVNSLRGKSVGDKVKIGSDFHTILSIS